VIDDGELNAARGSGEFLPCEKSDHAKPLQRLPMELDPKRNFGAKILF
jgi:dihydropyrimidinase